VLANCKSASEADRLPLTAFLPACLPESFLCLSGAIPDSVLSPSCLPSFFLPSCVIPLSLSLLGPGGGGPSCVVQGRSPLLLPEAFVRLWPNPGPWYVDPGGPMQPGLLQLPDPAAFHVRLSANWPVDLGRTPPPGL
jgi:hypothetical protein